VLEPWGADSRSASELATDETARVLNDARDCLWQGRISDALAIIDKVRNDTGLDEQERSGFALTALVARLALGDVRGAAPFARELTSLARIPGLVAARANYGLGEFTAARGQSEQALVHYQLAGEELTAADAQWWLPWRSGVARLIAANGEIATANGLVEDELAEARGLGSPYAVAYALRTRSAIAPTDQRVALLDEALEVLDGIGAERLDAQIRTDLAAWLLLLQPTESARAVSLLRTAEAYAGREELAPLRSRIRWLLERLGQQPDGELPGRLAELSAAERRVAQLVITGKRNREIALELGVSVKSVEWHVSHILRKLAITSRTQLAAALELPQPVDPS
jgi:DNA-binding CsgD family transcriptional regulator